MRIVIVGAGKIGSALTQQLSVDHRVTVIDQNAHLIENIINVYDVMGICGNGASYEIQQMAEVGKAELLLAATSSDEVNIVACLVAKKLGVKHTIARIRNPEYETQMRFMREELGLSMAINPEKVAATIVDRGEAIAYACELVDDNWVMVIAGNGADGYQKRGLKYIEVPTDGERVQAYIEASTK